MHKCPCDACGKNLKFPVEYAGMEIACPHCGQATLLKKPEGASLAPPPMAAAGRSTVELPTTDPLAGAAPRDLSSSEAEVPEGPDPFSCEFCGSPMEPAEKVCVECGERRPTVRNWSGTMIFRMVLGILLAFELIVLGLQWTTTGKPFGLRKHARHAVLVKLGLREEVKPGAAQAGGTNAPAALGSVDPDLVLADHSLKPDSDNGALYIHGTVKNISQYRYLAVKVKFQLKDRSGTLIPGADISAYVQTIEAGKEWQFKALVIDPDATGYEPILPVEGYR